MEIRVIHPGPLTTIQDAGRPGYRAAGVSPGGAADPFALRVTNLLVGNPDDAAVLECTLAGPTLEFSEATTLAVGGGAFTGVPSWQPIGVRAGEKLVLGPLRAGCRGYVAVAGGIDVPMTLGSRSTHLRARLGGVEGRGLKAGDCLKAQSWQVPHPSKRWQISRDLFPAYSSEPIIRVLPGSQFSEFDRTWMRQVFTVTPVSDRMGLRLEGKPLVRRKNNELLSGAVAPGTIQVPPDGRPIVLLADAQTIGGYPRIAHVIGVDLPLVAQVRPGDRLRFRLVDLAEAHRLWRAREKMLALLAQGLAAKLG